MSDQEYMNTIQPLSPNADKTSRPKETSIEKKLLAVAISFSMIGMIGGVSGSMLYFHMQKEPITRQAVAAAKKTAEDANGSSRLSGRNGNPGNSAGIAGKGSSYSALPTGNADTSTMHTAAEIYAANVNSTVGITTSFETNYYGNKAKGAASGSGFIFTSDGYIVTNYHVVEDATEIHVTLYDGTTYDAELVGFEESNDLAVLKIDEKDLVPVVLGDSDRLLVGDDVLAIGNPLGELTFSLTSGCVSALNRTVLVNDQPMDLIQTDCAINAGNSGGALFNMYGEVIGITNAKYSRSNSSEASVENIGFAIPIQNVRDIIDSIIDKGYVSRPYIGVYVETVTSTSQYCTSSGIGIHDVIADGPAERAGLCAGDVITKINGNDVTLVGELRLYLNRVGIGGTLTLTICRDGEEMEITVDVIEMQTSALG